MWNEGIKVWISALSHVALSWSWAGHLNFCIQNYPGDCKGNKLLQLPSCRKLLPLLWIKMVTVQVLQHFWAFCKELQKAGFPVKTPLKEHQKQLHAGGWAGAKGEHSTTPQSRESRPWDGSQRQPGTPGAQTREAGHTAQGIESPQLPSGPWQYPGAWVSEVRWIK